MNIDLKGWRKITNWGFKEKKTLSKDYMAYKKLLDCGIEGTKSLSRDYATYNDENPIYHVYISEHNDRPFVCLRGFNDPMDAVNAAIEKAKAYEAELKKNDKEEKDETITVYVN